MVVGNRIQKAAGMKFFIAGFVLMFGLSADAQAGTVAYTNATIETLAKMGTVKNGTVVVTDGKIVAVGKDAEVPATARIVDCTGLTIMPALVELYHPVTLAGSSSAGATRTITINGRTFTIRNSGTTTSSVFAKIADNLDPQSLKSDMKRLVRRGIGYGNLVTGGYGQAAQVRVQPDELDTAIKNPDGFLYMAVSNSTTSLKNLRSGLGSGGSSGSASSSREAALAALRSRSGSRTGARSSSGATSSASSSNPTTALWKDVKDGKKPLIINVSNPATILHVLKILKDHEKVKVILVSTGSSIHQTLDTLKKSKNLSIVLRPAIDTVPFSRDRVNVARMLHDAKIKFGFTTSGSSDITTMPDTPLFPLAMLVKTGLPRDVALKAATTVPASFLGLEKTLGSIEKDKLANMIFVHGDPLDASSRIQKVLVEGKTAHEG